MIADGPERSDEQIGAGVPGQEPMSAAEGAPLIPEGLYDVQTLRLERRKLWGASKSMISCEVVGGEYDGVGLIWCATSLPKGRRPPISSKMYRTIVMALDRRPERGERVSEGLLVHKMFRASVRTVTKGADGHLLPPAARYSVIDAFVERIA